MNQVFAYRFKSARQKNGFTLQDIAQQLGVSKQMVSKYERGVSLPDSPNLIKLAQILGERVDYFFRQSAFELQQVKFRKRSAYSQKKVNSLKASILSRMENYLIVEEILGIRSEFENPFSVQVITTLEAAEQVAVELRKYWNMGDDPIHAIINVLENHEIKVIDVDEPDQTLFDGVSAYVDNQYPVIAVNANFIVERKRFTLLHELGHLLLNIPDSVDDRIQESLCNRFAGAMLVPAQVIMSEIGRQRSRLSMNELVAIQKQYGISIPAILYRLADLNVVSENKKKQFFIRMNQDESFKQGVFATRFSGSESSERFSSLVYRALSQEMISLSKASALLNKDMDEVKSSLAII